MKTIKTLLVLLLLAALGAGAFVWSGVYPVGADVPHAPLTAQVIETLRDRAVAAQAQGIQVPNLEDAKLVAEGAEHYAAMCTGCHLAPGVGDTELRKGLYPQPPDLTRRSDLSPAQMFWTIKHGLKMTAMPAWGTTHDDNSIWGLVAFVRKLPGMTPEQFKTASGVAPEAEHHHHPDGGDEATHDHADDAHHDHEHGDGHG